LRENQSNSIKKERKKERKRKKEDIVKKKIKKLLGMGYWNLFKSRKKDRN
jgi:hypothetical protein